MTDREMLELAAKAAGLEVEQDAHIPSGGIWLSESDGDKLWNPLTDDGDALRLAVKLGFIVDIDLDEHVTTVDFTNNHEDFTLLEGHGLNPMEMTCRAITRAAALIGKDMK